MRRIALVLIILYIIALPVFSHEENHDESSALPVVELEIENLQINKDLTLSEKIQNIKAKEDYDTSKYFYLLEEITTKHFNKGPIESAHLFASTRTGFNYSFNQDSDNDLTYGFSLIDAGVKGDLRANKTYYEAHFRFAPQHNVSFLQYMPSNLYIANESIPNHRIMIGHTRTPSGNEGGLSTYLIPFYNRSQISRNFGNIRKIGVRVKGDYPLIGYDLGVYDSGTYFRSFFPGAEFTGMANIKPLGLTDGKYGKLNIGGWISTGKNHTDYFVSGAHAGWEYKKFNADFEWAKANGYNGSSGDVSTKHASGMNATIAYKITPKLQALARYDEFMPDKEFSNIKKREYSAGINYFIKGQALKLILNYVFCQNDHAKDSHKIILGMQILL